LCSLVAEDVEEQFVTKTTKLVEKSAPAAGLSIIIITALFHQSAIFLVFFEQMIFYRVELD